MSARREGARLLRAGDYARAIDQYRAALTEHPDDPELRAELARAYQGARQPDRAFHHFDRAARAFAALGDDARTASMLTAAERLHPDAPDVLHRLGRCLERLGRIDDVLDVARRLETAADAPGDRRRGWAIEKQRELRPDDPLARANEASFRLETGDEPGGAACFREALARRALAADRGELDRRLRRVAGERVELVAALAAALLRDGDAEEALGLVEPWTEHVAALEVASSALERLGREGEASAARVRLVKAASRAEDRERAAAVARALEASGPPEDLEALTVIARAMSAVEDASSADRWARIARAHHARGEASARDRAILSLLKSNPSTAEPLRAAAELLAASGRAAEAEALQRRIGDLETRRPPAALARSDRGEPTPTPEVGSVRPFPGARLTPPPRGESVRLGRGLVLDAPPRRGGD